MESKFVTAKELVEILEPSSEEWISTDSWQSDKCDEPEQIINAISLLRARVEQKFPEMTGDKQECLRALNLLDFWCTPLQDKGETSGFNDYLELTVQTAFDSDEHRLSWDKGFLKAHRITTMMTPNDPDLKEVSAHALYLLSTKK